MNRFLIGLSAVLFLMLTFNLANADPVIVGAGSTITVDEDSYTLVADPPVGRMWEAGNKACLCKMVAFRALQALGTYLNSGEFTSADINIVTGWNTDGPEELFTHINSEGGIGLWNLGTSFKYADPVTPGPQLTLADAWYQFSVTGSGTYRVGSDYKNYRFAHDKKVPGYVAAWDFFDYRTAVQSGTASKDQRSYFQNVIRDQIVTNLKGETFFEVNAVPVPGALWLFGTGLAALAVRARRKGRRG